MVIVMLILLMVTATAVFAVHATTYEIRAAGHMRQAMQAQYVAETGLTGSLAMVDSLGPAALLHAMERSEPPHLAPFEPELLTGKQGYRMYLDDFSTGAGMPVTTESLGGDVQPYAPLFAVDVNDNYVFTGVIAGHRSDGHSRLRFMQATYTSRGRTRLASGDFTSAGDTRGYHESASDARAEGLSGPFGE